MITKEYLHKNKVNNYVKVCIAEPESLGLSAVYESLFSSLEPQINVNEVFVVDYERASSGLYGVILDVEDVDFSEFED